jgi:hypothetical protein
MRAWCVQDAMEETLSSLDYALKAKSIENRPTVSFLFQVQLLLKLICYVSVRVL